jgi:hypothetical protein
MKAIVKIKAVVKTAIYVNDLDEAEDFTAVIIHLLPTQWSIRVPAK